MLPPPGRTLAYEVTTGLVPSNRNVRTALGAGAEHLIATGLSQTVPPLRRMFVEDFCVRVVPVVGDFIRTGATTPPTTLLGSGGIDVRWPTFPAHRCPSFHINAGQQVIRGTPTFDTQEPSLARAGGRSALFTWLHHSVSARRFEEGGAVQRSVAATALEHPGLVVVFDARLACASDTLPTVAARVEGGQDERLAADPATLDLGRCRLGTAWPFQSLVTHAPERIATGVSTLGSEVPRVTCCQRLPSPASWGQIGATADSTVRQANRKADLPAET